MSRRNLTVPEKAGTASRKVTFGVVFACMRLVQFKHVCVCDVNNERVFETVLKVGVSYSSCYYQVHMLPIDKTVTVHKSSVICELRLFLDKTKNR